jgi:DUF3017 family protein
VPADRAATGRDSETDTSATADTSANADTSTKADASTKTDAVMRAEAPTRVEAPTRADAATRAEAADRSGSERREDSPAPSDAAGQGAESTPDVQDVQETKSHGTSAAEASVPGQEPAGTEPEAGRTPDAKQTGAEPSGAEEAAAGQVPGAKPHGTEPSGAEPTGTEPTGTEPTGAEPHPAHADEGDSGGTPAEDAEADADAAREGEPTARDAVSAPGPDGRPRRVTRRFPLFTRDTARPEGGGRAAPRDAPAPVRQWPILAVTGTVGLGLLLTALDLFKFGTLLIGVALLAGGVMRWMLPDVGMLAVRSRFTDLVTYSVLGVTIALLAMMAQPNPLLEIPFLDDTLHFTIRT